MKHLLIVFVMLTLVAPGSGLARTLEVEVHGLTCAFCVDSLERAFRKIDSVRDVRISLEHKKLRLLTTGELPTDETIRQTILDAGFTPLGIVELPDAVAE